MSIHRIENVYFKVATAVETLNDKTLLIHSFIPVEEPPKVGCVKDEFDNIVALAHEYLTDPHNRRHEGRYLGPVAKWVDHVGEYVGNFKYSGSAVFSLEDVDFFGAAEWTAYSLWELPTMGRNELDHTIGTWRNRFNFTNGPKSLRAARWRFLNQHAYFANIYVPFVTDKLSDLRIEVKSCIPIVTLGNTQLGEPVVEDLKSYGSWEKFYWHVESVDPTPIVGKTEDGIQLVLKWNDGRDCNESVTLSVESDAGYLPRRKVHFLNGRATVYLNRDDLGSGEIANLKFSSGSFSNISSIAVLIGGP